MSRGARETILIWLYSVPAVAAVAGVVGAFFAAVRPQALITIEAGVVVLLLVIYFGEWRDTPPEERRWANVVTDVGVIAFIGVVLAGGLSLLYAPWRAAGLWFYAGVAATVI